MVSTEPGPSPLSACALCDGDDALGVGLCSACLTTGAAERALVFVRPHRAERSGTGSEALDRMLDMTDVESARAELRSGRPLLGVPAAAAKPVVGALEQLGVGARCVPVSRAWLALPPHFYVMLVCMVGIGALAGLTTMPSFLWLSPVFALSMLLVAQRSVQRPVVTPTRADAWPADLHGEIAVTLFTLRPGTARDRLIDVLRIGRPLTAELDHHGVPARIRDAVHDLLRAACETARETDRLGQSADVFRSSLVWTPEVAGEDQADAARAVLLRCSDLVNRGISGLTEAVTALGRIDADAAGLDGPVGSELQELTRDLEAAARVHSETFRELKALLD